MTNLKRYSEYQRLSDAQTLAFDEDELQTAPQRQQLIESIKKDVKKMKYTEVMINYGVHNIYLMF